MACRLAIQSTLPSPGCAGGGGGIGEVEISTLSFCEDGCLRDGSVARIIPSRTMRGPTRNSLGK